MKGCTWLKTKRLKTIDGRTYDITPTEEYALLTIELCYQRLANYLGIQGRAKIVDEDYYLALISQLELELRL